MALTKFDPESTPKRIFVDASYTISSGRSSGIERVVRNLLRESEFITHACDLPVPQCVVSVDEHFYAVDEVYRRRCEELRSMQANVLAHTSSVYRGCVKLACRLTRSAKLKKWFLPQAGHLGIFKLWHSYQERRAREQLKLRSARIASQPGDLFLLPDAYWINRLRKSVWSAVAEARGNGAAVCSLLYDLIPLTHPEYVGEKRRDAFLDYLTKMATHSDLIVAISQTVEKQVKDFLPTIATPDDEFCHDIRSFQLGAELSSVEGVVRQAVHDVFDHDPAPYLMVATFDPRKNHEYLLDAFEHLWERGERVSLCLVGRIGSRCDELVQRVLEHTELGERLHLFDDLSDAELHHCYQRARGVVFPSKVEGFGLPIVESLWFGRKTFVSDTLIHREVGKQDCTYFDLASPQQLAEQIVAWEEELERGESASRPRREPVTWRSSTEQVLEHCLQALQAKSSEPYANEVAA